MSRRFEIEAQDAAPKGDQLRASFEALVAFLLASGATHAEIGTAMDSVRAHLHATVRPRPPHGGSGVKAPPTPTLKVVIEPRGARS